MDVPRRIAVIDKYMQLAALTEQESSGIFKA
jgi:hypothetical protein